MRASLIAALCAGSPLMAQDAPYAGQQSRTISSFSEADIAVIEAGEGWGLALPAELNGWPGPAHVLEQAVELGLDQQQIDRIETIFAAMRADAQKAGHRMLVAEQALDAGFRSGEIDSGKLDNLLAEAAEARAALRKVHLAAHLNTAPLLSQHQRMIYTQLRGYAGSGHGDNSGHEGHGGSH
ncbi:hypothetical protein R3X27_03145 [Tropicimonas sp. TH_r6]|uniref:periplasmic heavy metal sensor n=1 Tax=Tropicimonas sp. TH_r6 TaxID=3082085 RepID=UPI0029533A33|nr:periplasmic heavy metal sensor [Tropicimonas sp. TH_r6]MDV7141672.1 hypothetical protein [Tropicimonas sp. TH_r6]